jgi:hypothetical protein
MGRREVVVKESAAETIADIAWYIESKGLIATADKFIDDAYDYFIKMAHSRKSYNVCKEPTRYLLGYKCLPYKKKYTVVFIETETELIIVEFIPSKLIHW